jgi:hypothetical protein
MYYKFLCDCMDMVSPGGLCEVILNQDEHVHCLLQDHIIRSRYNKNIKYNRICNWFCERIMIQFFYI